MEQNSQADYRYKVESQLREAYGRVTYTQTCHDKIITPAAFFVGVKSGLLVCFSGLLAFFPLSGLSICKPLTKL